MKTYLYLTCVLLLLISIGYSETVPAGTNYLVYNISKCQGPVSIKVTSEFGVDKDEINIHSCDYKSDNVWVCECNNNFPVIISTLESTYNTYDFSIKYYIEYNNIKKNTDREPALDEIERENNLRIKKILNVFVNPEDKKYIPFKLDVQAKNAVFVSVVIFIIIVIFILTNTCFKFRKSKSNNDVLNYNIQTNNKDVDDIFNKIK